MALDLPIVCKATKWFIWRALLMLIMFGGFGVYFLYDGMIGYPEKNVVIAHYRAFVTAGNAWTEDEKRNNWEQFASEQTIPFEEDRSIYPADTNFEEKWPAILADKAAMADISDEGLWKEYSGQKGWPQAVNLEEDPKPAYKIREQFIAAGVCLLLTLVALYFFIRTRKRCMKVDGEAYYEPSGTRIPFSKMTCLDKRKWETKGLATITYTDQDGKEEKVKVDGMVYGQFKEEEGAPAEALFQHILANFQGELIELVEEDDEEEDDTDQGENGGAENVASEESSGD